MKMIHKIIADFSSYLEGKSILEIACGDSDFSLNAARYATHVCATDISLERINKRELSHIPRNIKFEQWMQST